MNATLIVTITLTAVLLLVAWLLGQLPTAAKRLAVVFVAAGLASWLAGKADEAGATDAVKIGILIACGIGGIALAWWLLQPWLWGIEDYLAEWDAQEEQP